jgi:23S rRNA (uridine2552-2'-O)-methyltransferase
MSSNEERKREYYYKKAKNEGYRARSAYKLKQLQQKFYIIKRGDFVVDLGAAPGGWLQVAAEITGKKGKVIGVDKEYINPLNLGNVETIQMDMQSKDLKQILMELTDGKKIDVIISDLAGNVSGNWSLDADRQNYLVLLAFEVCNLILKEGGTFVTKVFRGSNIEELDRELKPRFEKLRRYRPQATRKQSAEEYYICIGFKLLEDD